MSEENVDALASGLIRTMDALKVDRPSTWSKSFEGLARSTCMSWR